MNGEKRIYRIFEKLPWVLGGVSRAILKFVFTFDYSFVGKFKNGL